MKNSVIIIPDGIKPRSTIDKPLTLSIKKIIQENSTIRSFYFDYRLNSQPGQFLMVWIPGVDEKPFAVGRDFGDGFFLTIAKVGPATEELFKLKAGDKLGIRGPYGNHFKLPTKKRVVLVGGGYGTAVLFSLLEDLYRKKFAVDFLIGARSKNMFILLKEIKKYSNLNLHLATDDGSTGFKGFVTDLLVKILDSRKNQIDIIFTCGPEIMMKKISDVAWQRKIDCQLSIERYMKCGFGICGNCALEPDGLLVCVDGTIFSNKQARKIKDFGSFHRDAEGKKHYFSCEQPFREKESERKRRSSNIF